MLPDFIPPSSFLRHTFFMDLSLGDRVFYTRSNSLRVPATVVGMAGDGFIHLEYYQDALRVVSRQCKMESSCVFLRVATSALFMAFPVVHDVCYVMGR